MCLKFFPDKSSNLIKCFEYTTKREDLKFNDEIKNEHSDKNITLMAATVKTCCMNALAVARAGAWFVQAVMQSSRSWQRLVVADGQGSKQTNKYHNHLVWNKRYVVQTQPLFELQTCKNSKLKR